MNPSSESVRHVHAGNKFHFRWAARRCLRLLNPLTELVLVKIEGSKEADHPGECVIDVAEYYKAEGKLKRIEYFQLKHSSTRPVPTLTFSTASDTLAAFAKRFRSFRRQAAGKKAPDTRFHIVTNRKLSQELASAVEEARGGAGTQSAGMTKLRAATRLKGKALQAFAQCLVLNGTEGDYRSQTRTLQATLSEFLVGFADDEKTRRIVDLVEEKALPDSPDGGTPGEITREDVLKQFSIDRPQKLFPARPVFEKLKKTIQREQHQELLDAVTRHSSPLIIEAAGGVGKSVVARELAQGLPGGSVGLVYDCFGAGKYRNPNEPRHLASVAMTEMANELAELGLCHVMLPMNGSATEAYYDGLAERLKEAISNLKAMHPAAMLVLFIDAADNAAVAADLAREQHCFVEHLWRLPLPEGCRLVMLCRPERRFMLKAPSTVRIHELRAFSDAESLWHLRRVFPAANPDDGSEFRRLSSGNPRVQSVVLAIRQPNVRALLDSLGAGGQTVDDQINAQLQLAIEREKELQGRPADVSAICHGLANLPPFIPLKVLAAAANVEPSTIRSFVSGLGRSVWFTKDSVQFRDEPTETWFREQFSATPSQIGLYVDSLRPLATQFTYVAKAMPELLEKAGRYEEVISLAASPDGLPTNSPIDQRDVRVYRLRFAFKAALKQSRLSDAVRISFLAGEETAGSSRQLRLLNANIDLVGQLRDAHQVEQLVQSGELSGAWDGSGTVYEASLLSCVADFRPEARNRLHSARRWLRIYFDERKRKQKADEHWQERLENAEVIELVWAMLNLSGAQEAVRYIEGWTPKSLAFPVMSGVLRRLVDAGRFTEIVAIGTAGADNVFIAAAVAREMMAVGHLPGKKFLRQAVNVLTKRRDRPPTEFNHQTDHGLLEAFLCTLEAAVPAGIPHWRILRALNHYTRLTADSRLSSRHTDSGRTIFMRGVALRTFLLGKPEPKPESLLLKTSRKRYPRVPDQEERKEIIEMFQGVLPWYCLRLRLIAGDVTAESTDLVALRSATSGSHRYHQFDRLPIERSVAHFQCLLWKKHPTSAEFDHFVLKSVNQVPRKFLLNDLLEALRAIIRAPHLAPLADPTEKACLSVIKAAQDEPPDIQASSFILLSRAMLDGRTNDARAYFKDAVEIVSRFGDEVADRWQAVVALANRASDANQIDEETAFRFLRIAELVGSAGGDAQRDWDCDSTVACALRMHPGATWAAIARWRDREVSWFSHHLREAILASMRLGQISPAAAWCGSGFSDCHTSGSFHGECLQAESDGGRRERMLECAAQDTARDKCGDGLAKLLDVAKHSGLSLERFETVRAAAPPESISVAHLPEPSIDAATEVALRETKWTSFFQKVDLFDPLSIAQGLEELKGAPPPRNAYEFWPRAVKAVPVGRELDFLKTALKVEGIDYEDVGKILGHAQDNWLSRASVRREWPLILEDYGRRFARSVANSHRRVYWYGKSGLSDNTLNGMRKGMLAGLTEAAHDMHAVTFFGFIESVGPRLTNSDALELLSFALARFEQYLALEFADGPYSAAMASNAAPPTAYAGMIWSSLANPGGTDRWEAAHTARRLVEMHCSPEVNALMEWMRVGQRGAFGAPRYPFYGLHAKLYLLIAFARAARSDAMVLRPHAAAFIAIALEGLPHVLFHQNAAEIALSIEQQFPETIPPMVVLRLKQVGQSPHPNCVDKVYSDAHAELPAPLMREVDPALEYNLGMDFESDWTSSLARVFSLPRNQVTALTRATVIRALGQPSSKEYVQDPRRDLWFNEDRGTYIHHHSYPRTDDHQFYLAYHALMIVAGRLLTVLPAVRSADSPENEWTDWLRGHTTKRKNGTWLSDRRDPAPEKERAWVHAGAEVHWSWAIQPSDFLDVLIRQSSVTGWIVARGNWNDCKFDRTESMNVTSALVDPTTAQALANSCRWSDPYRYYLPLFGDEDSEVRSISPFDLVGWIARGRESDDARDSLDPYAKNVDYPPFTIGRTYHQLLKLERDEEMRHWWFGETQIKAALAEVWSDGIQKHRDPPRRQGERISVSPELLRRLCLETGKHVIFSVQIGRSVERDSALGYDLSSPPKSHQIFIYTPDGHIHGAKESHRIG